MKIKINNHILKSSKVQNNEAHKDENFSGYSHFVMY